MASITALGYTAFFYYKNYLENNTVLQTIFEVASDNFTSTAEKLTTSFTTKQPATPEQKKYLVIEYRASQDIYSGMYPSGAYTSNSGVTKTEQTLPTNAQIISVEKVTNVGYTFYLGAIDNPSSSPINDDLKNQITNIINTAHFPQSFLNNLSIIMVNSLAATPLMYIETPNGWIKVDNFSPAFLSEGGVFTNYYGLSAIILLNKPAVSDPNNLKGILTHELGHNIEMQMTDADWGEYYKLRSIPSKTPRNGTAWKSSPMEDFAEVYKNILTGSPINTNYGFLEPVMDPVFEISGVCGKLIMKKTDQFFQDYLKKNNIDSGSMAYFNFVMSKQSTDVQKEGEAVARQSIELQNCRHDVMLHPEKYTDEWRYGAPYTSTVTDATRGFVQKIINRLH